MKDTDVDAAVQVLREMIVEAPDPWRRRSYVHTLVLLYKWMDGEQ